MQKLDLDDFDKKLPDQLNLAVVMQKQPSTHPWADFRYDALGVVVREADEAQSVTRIHQDDEVEHFLVTGLSLRLVTRIHQDDEVEHFLVTGLSLRLHVDECESYYHNLMSPEPGCFIVASQPESGDEMPLPYLVSLSFDEVHAYLLCCDQENQAQAQKLA
jgi:hypothetical protein